MRERGASCRGGLNGWLAGTSGALPEEALDLRRSSSKARPARKLVVPDFYRFWPSSVIRKISDLSLMTLMTLMTSRFYIHYFQPISVGFTSLVVSSTTKPITMRSIPALAIALLMALSAANPTSGFIPPTGTSIAPAVRRGNLHHLSAGFFGGGGGGGSDDQGDDRTSSGQKMISQKRRAQLGINADEEEYDLVRTAVFDVVCKCMM